MSRDEMRDALLNYVQSESRICPMPIPWNDLWQMLPGRPEYAGSTEPWPPLILAGWWASTDSQKAERLAYHIEWAWKHDALERVDAHLRKLPISDWHHSDPAKPRF